MIEFQGFGKIPRLFRDVTITEKIDGSNAAVGIKQATLADIEDKWDHEHDKARFIDNPEWQPGEGYLVYAQSRSRVITPAMDNHGFARWAWENAEHLVTALGPGLHFGEWWGSGINRGYGLQKGDKLFSLFNTKRWCREDFLIDGQCNYIPPGLGVVPVLYQGEFSTLAVKATLEQLRLGGSVASPGFMRPEGVVIYHAAGNYLFKSTIEDDEVPKAFASKGRRHNSLTLVKVPAEGASYELAA